MNIQLEKTTFFDLKNILKGNFTSTIN